jgi:hypothetical protein
MTPNQFEDAIRKHMDGAIAARAIVFNGDYGQTFSALIGAPGQASLGIFAGVFDEFQSRINNGKQALGLPNNVDLRTQLKNPPTVVVVVNFYLTQTIGTLISDTAHVLRPMSPFVI